MLLKQSGNPLVPDRVEVRIHEIRGDFAAYIYMGMWFGYYPSTGFEGCWEVHPDYQYLWKTKKKK